MCSALHSLPLSIGVLALAACAGTAGPVVINGVPTPRTTMEFVGNPYSIRHTAAHPRPGSPSGGVTGDGGTITGTVCGADIQYHVSHNGDHVRVNGFVNMDWSMTLEIREEPSGARHILGGLSNFPVDVTLAEGTLSGTVGQCQYELHPDAQAGDTYSQRLRIKGYNVSMRIKGRETLAQLPAADQAALAPLMLYCATAKVFQNLGQDPPELGFGGRPGVQPLKTIDFFPQSNRSCGSDEWLTSPP